MRKINRSDRVKKIQAHIKFKVREVLDYFGVEYREYEEWLSCACPIHGGDNPTGFTITINEHDEHLGFWRCWTKGCESEFYSDTLGLVKGLLSITEDTPPSFSEVIDFCEKFLGEETLELPIPKPNNGRVFSSRSIDLPTSGISREKVRDKINIPSDYYVGRGFLPETLDKFDVGLCVEKNKPMYGRVVVPVYDDSHKYMVGCVGRRTNDGMSGKWINSKGFRKSYYLYNYWYAKEHIFETKTAILVEGQGDVWRLYESGIMNCVGMFGCSLSEQQRIILERSGALNLVILTDQDEAGKIASEKIRLKSEKLFNLYFPILTSKDVGDMTVEQIQAELVPQLEGLI